MFFCLYTLFVLSYVKLKKAKKKRLRASLLVCPIPSAAFILCQLLFIDYLRLIGSASGLSGIFDPRSVMPLSRLIIGPEYGLPEKYLLMITVLLYTAFICVFYTVDYGKFYCSEKIAFIASKKSAAPF